MVISRGEIWWADIPDLSGSGPAFRRPAVILQSDFLNQSRLNTVVVVLLTGNLLLAKMPGNVPISARESGLPRDSVINVTQMITLDRNALDHRVGTVSPRTMSAVALGVKLVLDL
jgi:mRNA interferase MazF